MKTAEVIYLCIGTGGALLVTFLVYRLFLWTKQYRSRHQVGYGGNAADLESASTSPAPSISVITSHDETVDLSTIYHGIRLNKITDNHKNELDFAFQDEIQVYRTYSQSSRSNKSTSRNNGTDINHNQQFSKGKNLLLNDHGTLKQSCGSNFEVFILPNSYKPEDGANIDLPRLPKHKEIGISRFTGNSTRIPTSNANSGQPKSAISKANILPTPPEANYRATPGPKSWHQRRRDQYHQNTEERLIKIREIQERHVVSPEHLKPLNCDLLICVDARPKAIGGYCIEASNHYCEFYSYDSSVLPWALRDKSITGDSGEFEMKNLLFALLLWESKILKSGRVEVHTDNPAIQPNENNKYGCRVQAFIHHFRQCHGIKIQYKLTNCRRVSNYDNFARFIQPADDFSRNRVFDAAVYLQGIYSIEEFNGAYENGGSLENFNNFQMKVKRSVSRWSKKACTCGFQIDNTDSLRIRLRS